MHLSIACGLVLVWSQVCPLICVSAQRTFLDVKFGPLYRPVRLLSMDFIGRSGDEPSNVALVERLGKTQRSEKRARSLKQFCDTVNGPGRRSAQPPTSVHRLRPGDIDIIAAMGDSLTAGNGIMATKIFHIPVENKGVSFSIGGQANWRKYLTLPNILKEFNPNLYGYSLNDGLSTDYSSKFNVAELGAMSRDVPQEAKVLVKRLTHDPRVNMTHHWKLVTLLIGNNDFCSDVCYYPDPMQAIVWHEQNMLKTYRYLRDNVPRLMLNVVAPPNLSFLTRYRGLPLHCHSTLTFECPCLMGRPPAFVEYMNDLMERWIAKDFEIVARPEFNTDDFTINIQPFTRNFRIPTTPEGNTDTRYLSADCFHLSQRGQALSTNGLWNNMLELPGRKSSARPVLFAKFLCPTKERPYLITRVNSKKGFQV